ncbi:MAG: CapA family protein [Muribaculaceae bacterium]|nr:CapA family protein [Muribaculaceae bacterium]
MHTLFTSLRILIASFLITSCAQGGNSNTASTAASTDSTQAVGKTSKSLPDSITIAMTGDIMMGTTYPTTKLPQNDGRDIFSDVAPVLSSAHVAVGNLEGAMADKGTPNEFKRAKISSGAGNVYAFLMPTRYAALLSDAGYDFVSMANNHSYDFGLQGQNDSRQALDKVGIGYAGNPGHEYMIKEIDGVRYGYCAFGYNRQTIHMSDEKAVRHSGWASRRRRHCRHQNLSWRA